MTETANIQDRVNAAYAGLSDKLKVAARFVADNPAELATRSLRSVAGASGVSPATFSRLARALGYRDYEELREEGRRTVERRMAPFSQRASALHRRAAGRPGRAFLADQSAACVANIEALGATIDPARLEAAVAALDGAGRVLLVGSRGSAGLVDYFGYMAHWFLPNWSVAGRNGTELGAALSRMGPGDAVFGLCKEPYARRTVAALRAGRARGATTLAITDSRTSPALQFSDHAFVVRTESPQFFSSYAATLVLMETIAAMLAARAGPAVAEAIHEAELELQELGENWGPN